MEQITCICYFLWELSFVGVSVEYYLFLFCLIVPSAMFTSGLLYCPSESSLPMPGSVKESGHFVTESINRIEQILTELSSRSSEITYSSTLDIRNLKIRFLDVVDKIIERKGENIRICGTRPKNVNLCKTSTSEGNSRVLLSYPCDSVRNSNLKQRTAFLEPCNELPYQSFRAKAVSSRNPVARKKCYYCQKLGHLISQCRFKNRECFYCGSNSHFIADCKLNPKPYIGRVKLRSDKNVQCDIQADKSISSEVTGKCANPELSDAKGPIVNLCNLHPGTLLRFPILVNDKPDTLLDSETVTNIIREEVLLNCDTKFGGGNISYDSFGRNLNNSALSVDMEDGVSSLNNSLSDVESSLVINSEPSISAGEKVEDSEDMSKAHEEWVKDFRCRFPSLAIGLCI